MDTEGFDPTQNFNVDDFAFEGIQDDSSTRFGGGLREFHILDEIDDRANDEDDFKENTGSCTNSDYDPDSDTDDEIAQEEIDAMLDEGLPEEFRASKKIKFEDGSAKATQNASGNECVPYEEKEKIVLEGTYIF